MTCRNARRCGDMTKLTRTPRFTPSMAVAILALVIAMSTSATAALVITGSQIKNGSVTGKDIKNRSVTGKDIRKKAVGAKHLKKNAVRSKHVKNGSLTGADIRDHSLTGTDVRLGSLTGEHLTDGSITTTDLSRNVIETLGGGASGFQVVTSSTPSGTGSGTTTASASCPTGKVAVSANSYWDGTNTFAPQIRRVSATTFSGTAPNPITLPEDLVIQVTCLTAG